MDGAFSSGGSEALFGSRFMTNDSLGLAGRPACSTGLASASSADGWFVGVVPRDAAAHLKTQEIQLLIARWPARTLDAGPRALRCARDRERHGQALAQRRR